MVVLRCAAAADVAKALLAPFVLYVLLDASSQFELGTVVSIIIIGLGIAVQTLFAITTHRVILLGAQAIPEWGLLRWSMRESLFVLYALALCAVVPMAVLVFIPVVGPLLAPTMISWVVGRLSLVFPGIAVDQGVTFGLSWKLTRNRQMLMVLVVIFLPLVQGLVVLGLGEIQNIFLVTSFLTAVTTSFTVAALSVAYRLICREEYGDWTPAGASNGTRNS